MERRVEPELLDDLAPGDPQAVGSRKDLQRLNRIMRHADIIARHLTSLEFEPKSGRIVELGAGDGTLLLSVARRLTKCWPRMQVMVVDQQSLVDAETRDGFQALGWELETVKADVFDWLPSATLNGNEAIIANLFLHHLSEARLRELFQYVARGTKLLVACEPRRTLLPLVFSRMLGLIGCNSVTRHDAVISVRAGFKGNELSALWPGRATWQLSEQATGFFSHVFVAARVN